MIVRIGHFLFHWRNVLFPLFYLLLFLPAPAVFADVRLAVALGLIVALTGQTVRVATIGLEYVVRGGRGRHVYAEDLVTEGIFAHCRNPMYVGNALVLTGLGLIANSLYFLVLVVPLFLMFYHAIVAAEESFLREKFGEAYVAYTRDVPRWVPRLQGLGATLSRARFQWRRVLRKEYNAAYLWMTGAVLLILLHVRAAAPDRWDTALPAGVVALTLLLLAYATVRGLKKSGRLPDV